MICTRPLSRNIGDGLGQWQFEGLGTEWRALAPKVYAYDTDTNKVRHAKGVPGAEKDDIWQRYADGQTIENNRGVAPLKTAVRGTSLFTRQKSHRTLRPRHMWVGARIKIGKSAKTRAPHVDELDTLNLRVVTS